MTPHAAGLRPQLVVFDLDGTLTDSAAVGAEVSADLDATAGAGPHVATVGELREVLGV